MRIYCQVNLGRASCHTFTNGLYVLIAATDVLMRLDMSAINKDPFKI